MDGSSPGVRVGPCNHSFHLVCISHSIESNGSFCPICRIKIEKVGDTVIEFRDSPPNREYEENLSRQQAEILLEDDQKREDAAKAAAADDRTVACPIPRCYEYFKTVIQLCSHLRAVHPEQPLESTVETQLKGDKGKRTALSSTVCLKVYHKVYHKVNLSNPKPNFHFQSNSLSKFQSLPEITPESVQRK